MFPLNVPNALTLVRILLVPVLVVALLDETPNGDLFAAIVFAVASLTDFVDGWIARSRNAVTTFGKLMDPVADKLLVVAALVALVSLDRLPANVFGIFMSLEPAVAAIAGLIVLGQSLGAREIVAIGFVVAASIGVSQTAAPMPPES